MKAAEWPTIEELGKLLWKEDEQFSEWARSVDDKHWAKRDISSLRIGYELGMRAADCRCYPVEDKP